MIFMENQSLILMTESLKSKSPILLLGAGFALGTVNHNERPLPSARELANELFDNVLAYATLNSNEFDELRKDRNDLKRVCTYLADERLIDKRNLYLVDRMKGCHCAVDSFHILLKEYPWTSIFSLNIDDLIEHIYCDTDLSIQIHNFRKEGKADAPVLIKLHGSVDKPDLGFIFDESEYRKFAATDNWLLTQFGIEYLKNDVILLGTEFQENDLLLIIEKFRKIAGTTRDYNYYFVTPKIGNRSLRREIEQTANMHHIEFTAEQFLNHIHKNIINVGEARRKMRDHGVIFIDEKKREIPRYSYNDTATLYLGELPRYQDFFNDWDIRYPTMAEFMERSLKDNQHFLLTLYGDSYVGKSCVAMRIMVDLLESGFITIQFDLSYSLNARKYFFILLEFMKTLPNGSKLAVLTENMPYFYDTLKQLIQQCPHNITQFVIVSTGNTSDHLSKKYLLESLPFWREHKISEKITSKYACNIHDKLKEKNHLNKLRSYGDSRYEIVGHIIKCNDIIDALYVSQEGRPFINHFYDWLTNQGDNANLKAFAVISCFSLLNIQSVPLPILSGLLQRMLTDFSFNSFKSDYAEAIRFQKGEIRLRCNRLLGDVAKIVFDEEIYQQIIINTVYMIAPSIQDREMSPKSELLQKLLKVKILCRSCKLSYKKIINLLNSVKKDCKHLSYFWIQYGIANRDLSNFEEANNAFSEAANIRGHVSYHIQHAQAKNYMAWSIWELEHKATLAPYYFDQGKIQMAELISSAPYQYFAYSVHTYIDMSLRYYQDAEIQITANEAQYMYQQLSSLLCKRSDNYLISITKRFASMCKDMDFDIDIMALENLLPNRQLVEQQVIDSELIYNADMLDDSIIDS